MRYMLTDDLWAAMAPLVQQAKTRRGGQRPRLSERMFFEALFDLARTGVPWRDLPSEFGHWDAVYHRFRRWVDSGALAQLFETMTANPEFRDVQRVLINSTVIRAHQHSAGARRKKKVGTARSATTQGLGRSRGGLTTKVVVAAVDEDTALVVDIVPGAGP